MGKENWVVVIFLRWLGVCFVNLRYVCVFVGLFDNLIYFGIDEYRRDVVIVFLVVFIWDVFFFVNCYVWVFGFSEVVINFV